ncbi:MAG: tetratricopeptide repeat protein [Pseudanabaena sp.]|jgi:tetratricopeptide (TPR) repeat protein|nr:tetratricopeptide repeat protein [Pseudanabaena sp. M090S1SP2A07QC]MCA6508238.1 tetratricopeptide repeat protein [Pseudanabaena sp. M172S2SP2A07QC]MCA6519659.1 tetratricopeptide repeat protein [Pseudanabaena sp. M110S1SP2A07QC]MCA6521676.1 tetratricopeptide repeat protein [Pseudanabaena sp. M051S1SP2A07QC]MCA6527728.1 tetratricopeptide repeat protein [Pseudanabaena sp. M179S2SP2A07QC]MCA6530512.1 tetratricopeptide repeat protein [Pseudanabaena sp. M125S2SP2A07QC]MCA6535065.1 tetratricopept
MSEDKSASQFLSDYRLALECLKSSEKELLPDRVIDVLVKRDSLQSLLSEPSKLTASELKEIESLDRSLKEQKNVILQVPNLDALRSLIKPPESNWWWYFSSRWDNWDWLWNGLTIAALTVSLSLVVNTSSRILSGGANSENTLYVVGQSVLTLMAGGGALTQVGQKSYEKILIQLRIPKEFWQETSCGLSWLLMVSLLGINAALPSWAHKVNRNGLENFDNKRIESAKADFQRAIAMRPNYGEAYYNLGWLYEELNDLDKAKAQYEVAVQSDPQRFDSGITYVKALNNLGRLYILKKEYGTAVHLLRKGFDRFNDLGLQDRDGKNMSKEQRDVYYSLYKNLGWARLMQESYDVAEARLKMAIKIDTNRSSAHCLLAQVVDAKFPQEPAKSLDLWRTCIAVVTPRDLAKPEEDEWSALANKRIEKILSGKEVKKE